jgi:hypothetical protein
MICDEINFITKHFKIRNWFSLFLFGELQSLAGFFNPRKKISFEEAKILVERLQTILTEAEYDDISYSEGFERFGENSHIFECPMIWSDGSILIVSGVGGEHWMERFNVLSAKCFRSYSEAIEFYQKEKYE